MRLRRKFNQLISAVRRFTSGGENRAERLGDFTTTARVIPLAGIAIGIGVLGALIALALLRLIGLFTNLFFFQRWSTKLVSPAGNSLGAFEVLIPIAGGLVVGVMARYGSERIRGHGIPEAIEAILIKGSRIEPRVAVLKPLSAAVSIGSGGPFGAEGPIIMTGGAVGSLVAQFLKLASVERKTLLVAGAAAGMSATFASPVAATLLGVELLLFEWKPRSLIPVALASATAAAMRQILIAPGPLFPTPPHPAVIGLPVLLGCVLAGLLAGCLSAILTVSVYAAEDAFRLLPIHWMWWPAIGGLVIGLGGLVFPHALGVGYDSIATLLHGDATSRLILGLLVVKSLIWSVSLGSGTSGGVLAPLLLMGGALGGAEALFLPNQGPGFWPMVSMGAILGGTMRSPFTGVIFILELTHDVNSLLPLLIAATCGHAFTVLTLRRSILTEKVARRGYHLSREYSTDPFEILFAREVARTNIVAFPNTATLSEVVRRTRPGVVPRGQHLFPVLDAEGLLAGVVTRASLHDVFSDGDAEDRQLADVINVQPVVAYADEPLRAVVYRMARTGFTRFPVVEHAGSRKLVGMIALTDLLKGRALNLEAEERRERVLELRTVLPWFGQPRAGPPLADGESSAAPATSTPAIDPRR